ncbi:phospholipase D-like domain-containing protein [Kineosporia babensis]|uniref:Phospholipase D-like domain-containing protein n=1 Tax=Kineosporia babensis TaxID=499548 RepID=A0A9X1NAB3_9ACTN|nr:phospholipase D-like domain-containing protein [Kineosporia babensis]MCD5309348.1 phospholipase D-like domain-containing protein [Kineosporia babensis]
MRTLVPFAVTIQELVPRSDQQGWLSSFMSSGAQALEALGLKGDHANTLSVQARQLGLLDERGQPQLIKMSELAVVMDVLDAIPLRPPVVPGPEQLVFTVPPPVKDLITPATRLDLLVNDVIARAASTLHIGGPFWNEGGWDLLEPVLLPALQTRDVSATFYLHPHNDTDLRLIKRRLRKLQYFGRVIQRWWAGGFPSLMHAKFVVADGGRGYFGSANLTSLGLGQHLELGVTLQPTQSKSLLTLLDALENAGLFKDAPE